MPSRWCPWCAGEIQIAEGAAPADVVTCAACGTRAAVSSILAAAPKRPLKPDDPEARLPPGAPEGSVPLPVGAATMSQDALIRYAVIFGAVVLAVAVLSIAIGRPLLSRLATPTPTPTPAPAATPDGQPE